MVTNHLYIQGENLFQKNTERDGTGHPIPSSNPTHKHTLTYACMHFSPANQQNPSNPNPPRSTCITTSSHCSLLDNAPSYRACFPPEGLCVNCSLCLKQKCAHLLQVLTQTACSLKRHGRLQYFNTARTEPLAVLTTQSFLITFHLYLSHEPATLPSLILKDGHPQSPDICFSSLIYPSCRNNMGTK